MVSGQMAETARLTDADTSLLAGLHLDGAVTDPTEDPDGVALAPGQDLRCVRRRDRRRERHRAPRHHGPHVPPIPDDVVLDPDPVAGVTSVRRHGPAEHWAAVDPRRERRPDEGGRRQAVLRAGRRVAVRIADGGRLPPLASGRVPEDRRHGTAHADRDGDPVEWRDLRAVSLRLLPAPHFDRGHARPVVFGHGTGVAAVAVDPPVPRHEGRLVPRHGSIAVRDVPTHRPRLGALGGADRRLAVLLARGVSRAAGTERRHPQRVHLRGLRPVRLLRGDTRSISGYRHCAAR